MMVQLLNPGNSKLKVRPSPHDQEGDGAGPSPHDWLGAGMSLDNQ